MEQPIREDSTVANGGLEKEPIPVEEGSPHIGPQRAKRKCRPIESSRMDEDNSETESMPVDEDDSETGSMSADEDDSETRSMPVDEDNPETGSFLRDEEEPYYDEDIQKAKDYWRQYRPSGQEQPEDDYDYDYDSDYEYDYPEPLGVHNKKLGRRGENAATHYLELKGFEVLYRNWTCPAGEADIIALDEDTVVFVEVKTRTRIDRGFPCEAVDCEKRARYEKIAAYFLKEHNYTNRPVRFDIVDLLVVASDRALVRHLVNAFGVV